jgi:hypothetical protein
MTESATALYLCWHLLLLSNQYELAVSASSTVLLPVCLHHRYCLCVLSQTTRLYKRPWQNEPSYKQHQQQQQQQIQPAAAAVTAAAAAAAAGSAELARLVLLPSVGPLIYHLLPRRLRARCRSGAGWS